MSPCGWGNLGDAAIQDAVIQNITRLCPGAELWGFTLNPDDTRKRHHIPSYPISGVLGLRGYWIQPTVPPKGNDGTPIPSTVRQSELLRAKLRSIPFAPMLWNPFRRLLMPFRTAVRVVTDEIRHIVRSYRLLRDMDALIATGGGQLDEFWGGPWGHPYSLFKWAALAKLVGTRFVFLSVGSGSLDSWIGRFFVKKALSLATYRSYRDEVSKQVAESLKVRGENLVFPDLAYSLPVVPKEASAVNKRRIVVGVSPIVYGNPGLWPTTDMKIRDRYLEQLSSFVVHLITTNHSVLFFATTRSDRDAIKEVESGVRTRLGDAADDFLSTPGIDGVDDLFLQLSFTDLVIASRLHGVLLSHVAYKPVLAISYDKKVDILMSQMEQRQYCLDIRTVDQGSLLTVFQELENNRDEIKDHVAKRVTEYRGLLNQQYSMLLSRLSTCHPRKRWSAPPT